MLLSRTLPLVLFTCVLALGIGCKKEAGEGGNSEIRGVVYRKDAGRADSSFFADHRVYIVYGDADFHHDDVRTDGQGKFVFRWLRKGKYRIYAFSECLSIQPGCAGGLVEISRSVEITERKQTVQVPSITAINY